MGAVFLMLTSVKAYTQPLRLWYQSPAETWEASLPLGNGRLGAMPDGGITQENVVLNDITLWSGGRQDADMPQAHEHLREIQQLLLAGKNLEAQEVMNQYFICKGKGSGHGDGADVPYGSYQILANLRVQYHHPQGQAADYQRALSLDDATATTRYRIGDVTYTREYFTSFADDVIVIRLTASQGKQISFTLGADRPERAEVHVAAGELQLRGQLNNGTDGKGMRYDLRVGMKLKGGQVTSAAQTITVTGADEVMLYVAERTDFRPADLTKVTADLQAAMSKSYAALRQKHVQLYQSRFGRATLQLGNTAPDTQPTDRRVEAFNSMPGDRYLPVLYFQYGRYLLISSTRPDLLPPNLQGLWCNTIHTPWNGDYHLNINIQMNHFPLEVTNLGELNEPFFALVQGLVEPGQRTARAYYDAPGWVAHVITNVWGYTSPGEHYSWGSFNTGSAWLCQMLWEHYRFTKDETYLKRLYPILKGSAQFYLHTLVKEPTHGWLVTAPSNSPENGFKVNGQEAHVCEGPTMDNQLVRYLFQITHEAAQTLKTDAPLRQQIQQTIPLLPPNQIGPDGRLQEWMRPYEEVEPHHRHVSHLWGLHPGNELASSEALMRAARATLEARGDDATGWSLAWKMNFWARLHDGDRAYKLLQKLLRPVGFGDVLQRSTTGGSYANLFCAHPPFQIDGNFGGTAGIAEMLLQSHAGYIELLPALPGAWPEGSFTGWRVTGGGEVSATWQQRKIQQVTLKAMTTANTFTVKVPDYANQTTAQVNGKAHPVKAGKLTLSLAKGQHVIITFLP